MDKNKIIEAAAKLVAKGAYDKAIKEYQKVLDVDPKDVRILQKMAELYVKRGDNAQAASFFTKVAESYTADGFFLKAVAQYKQVLKLAPSMMEIHLKLAELHQQLQLMSEAMASYQLVAKYYDEQGDTRRSLEVLRKMVELDPDNVNSRSKLADLYVREGMNAEAISELSRAAENYKRNGRTDDYVRVAERIAALQPDNLQLARELAEAYLAKNDQKRALAKLQICFKADNRDIDTLRLLAVAFQGLGQTSKTVSVYKELARAYEDKNFHDDAERVWAQLTALDPNDADVVARRNARAPAAPAPVAAPAPAPMRSSGSGLTQHPQPSQGQPTAVQSAYTPAAPPAAPARPRGDSLGKLLTETDVYVKYGLHDKALEHLRKVFAVDPENIDAHEKAYAIYVAANNQAQAFEQLLNVLRLHTRSGDAARAQPYLATILQQNPGHPEVPVFLATLRMDGPTAAAPVHAPTPEAEDAILVDSSDDEVIVADDPDEIISAEMSMGPEGTDAVDALAHDEVMLSPSDADAAGLVEVEPPPVPEYYDANDAQVVSDFEAETPSVIDQPFDDVEAIEPEPSTGEFAVIDDQATSTLPLPVHTEPARPPLPEFAIEAASQPELGEERFEAPTRVSPALELAPMRGAATFDLEPGPDPFADEPPTTTTPLPEEAPLDAGWDAAPVEEAVEAPPDEEPAGEECDEATFFVEQGLYDEAREILETVLIAYPDHRRAAELMARVEAESAAPVSHEGNGVEGGRDAFDLAAELASELGDFTEEEQTGENPQANGAGDEYQVSVEEVFAEFKKGLEKVVKPEDVDTHYDLGVAYKEMGLVDDAIGEFEIARKGCLGKRKEIDCLSMIGMLQVGRGESGAAVEAYQLALQSEHAKADVEKSLRYELAGAYEVGQQPGRALFQFQRVQAIDPSYRDVGSHVTRLAAVALPEDDAPGKPPGGSGGGQGGGRRKVGYV